MRTLLIATALAASSLGRRLAAQSTKESIDAVINRATAAWTATHTMHGTFEQTAVNPLTGTSATARGTYAEARPNLLAIRFTAPEGDAIVSDGTALWLYLPASAPGQVVKRRAADQASLPIDLVGSLLDAPRAKYDITDAGTHPVDGHPAHGLVLVPKSGTGAPFNRAVVWVDDDDSLIREFETSEGSGVERRIHLTSIDRNATIPRGTFAFTPPNGVRIVDQTRP